MGIRLSKRLGWGFTDVQYENGHITDPRISVSSSLLMPPDEVGPGYLGYLEALRDAEHEESDAWFDVMMSIAMVKDAAKHDGSLPWPVVWLPEGGLQNVLLIQPVGFSRWSRYDDPIDVAEEYALHADPLGGRVVPLPYGIFPFEGLYMDSRDGRKLDSTAKRTIDRLLDNGTEGGEVRLERRRAADHLARAIGFTDAGQAREHIAPVVPSDILNVISWLNLFNGPDCWRQLRPMLYVYWS